MRRTRRLAGLAMAVAWAASGWTPAARAQLGQDLDGGVVAGAPTYPDGLPDAPDAGYTAPVAPASPPVGNSWFDIAKDTPAFSNQSNAYTRGGTCIGMCILVIDWYGTFVAPIRGQWNVRFWADHGKEVSDGLGVAGPVHRDNLEQYRLRAYSRVEANRPRTVRLAIKYQYGRQKTMGNPTAWGDAGENHEYVYDHVMSDIRDSSDRLGPLRIKLDSADGGEPGYHALLAYEAQATTATAGSHTEPAMRVRFFDPNVVISAANRAAESNKRSLLYFTRSQRFAFDPGYVAHWASHGRVAQSGEFLADRDLGYMTLHSGGTRDDMNYMIRLLGDPTAKDPDSDFMWSDAEQHN